MVSTKHCCWGECRSDSRYPDKLHKSLKEMVASANSAKIFIPFPKPSLPQNIDRCHRWISACCREHFTINDITRNTYVCALHWPGKKGPTQEFPDPLKANFTPYEIKIATRPKRKAPRERNIDAKRTKKSFDDSKDSFERVDGDDGLSFQNEFDSDINPNNKGTQTEVSKHELSIKVEKMILRNKSKSITDMNPEERTKVVSCLSYAVIVKDSSLMKHFVGLTSAQFECLHNFLNDVCPLSSITYWSCKGQGSESKVSNAGRISQWSTREKLFICLLRLKSGFTVKTISVLLSGERRIGETTIRNIFTTFIQLMFKIFRQMEDVMFPSKEHLQRFRPKVFKTIKNIRCSVDCTEFRVQTSRNFARQGNTFSSYKHANTFKCLIAVTPNGGACFVSDLFEGDINDVHIFEESGILKHIRPHDLILVDRGFTVQELLNPLQASVKIPAFLKGRDHLSVAEELSTRKIAKARIHIERFNQRLKVFKLIGRTIPLSLSPLATQMVVVACGLVNFQECLCK